MNRAAVRRGLAGIAPIAVSPLIRPLCALLRADESFAETVRGRSTRRICSPWERAGLFFLEDNRAAFRREKINTVVNRFSQQIVFQLFPSKNPRGSMKLDPSGVVFLSRICHAAARSRALAASANAWSVTFTRVLRGITGNVRIDQWRTAFAESLALGYAGYNAEFLKRIRNGLTVLTQLFGRLTVREIRGLIRHTAEKPSGEPRRITVGDRGTKKSAAEPTSAAKTRDDMNGSVLSGETENFGSGRKGEVLSVEPLGDRLDSRSLKALGEIIGRTRLAGTEGGGNTVMLPLPAQADGGRGGSGYDRRLPPMEYKRNDREQANAVFSERTKIINEKRQTQTVKHTLAGGFDGMSREEINKLADKVYAQIEARVLRERRRMGM